MRIGLDLDKFHVVGILSNPRLAVQMYGKGSYSLKRLLERFGCPSEKLHDAANDSNHALQFLLMLFGESHWGESCGTERLALLSAFKELCMLLCLKSAKGMRKLGLYEVFWSWRLEEGVGKPLSGS